MRKSKKAIQTTTMNLIIILVVAIVLFLFAEELINKLQEPASREVCRLSVLSKSKTKVWGTESPFFLDCYTDFIRIKEDGIYIKPANKDDENLDLSLEGKDKQEAGDLIKKYLAGKLYDCWYQFGEGQIDFLGANPTAVVSPLRCFVCANIHFEETFLEGFKFGQWESYLSKTEIEKGKGYYKTYLTTNKVKNTEFYNADYAAQDFNSKKGGDMTIAFIVLQPRGLDKIPLVTAPLWRFRTQLQGYTTDVIVENIFLINSVDFPSKCDKLY